MRRITVRSLAIAAAISGWLALPSPASASFLFKKGSFTKITGVTTQGVTGVGFQPKAVIFFWTRQTTLDTFNSEGTPLLMEMGYGFSTGAANNEAIVADSQDAYSNISKGNTGKRQSSARCIILMSDASAQTVGAEAAISTFDPDGFTLNWTLNEARADVIHYIALGGSELTNATTGTFDSGLPATTGLQSVPLTFKPDFVMFLSAHNGGSNNVEAQTAIGFASGPSAMATVATQLEDGASTRNTCVIQRNDLALVEMTNDCDPPLAPDVTMTLSSFDSSPTGFTVNKLTNYGAHPIHFLALQGGRYKVGNFPKSTAAAPVDDPVMGVGFAPLGLILASKNKPASTANEEEGRVSFGAADGITEGAIWYHDKGANIPNPTITRNRTTTSKVAVLGTVVSAASTTLDAQANLKTFDPNGFTLRWTTNNAVPADMIYVAFGEQNERYRSIGTRVDYGTGEPPAEGGGTTVSATFGSRLVTGSANTLWKSANRGRGDRIDIEGFNYTVYQVLSETQLELTTPFLEATGGGKAYTIARQFGTLQAWEDCISFAGPCGPFPVGSASLVADDRSEVGIAYKETALARVVIESSTTDALHTITLTADPGNRHNGTAGGGVVLDNGSILSSAIEVRDDFVTVEWLEIKGGGAPGADGIYVDLLASGANANQIVLRQNLIHNAGGDGIEISDPDTIIDAYNNIIYRNGRKGIFVFPGVLAGTSQLRILNNTIFSNTAEGVFKTPGVSPATIRLQNNIAHSNGTADFSADPLDSLDPVNSTDNLSGDTSAVPNSPGGGGINAAGSADGLFKTITVGSEDLHLELTAAAVNQGVDLSGIFTADIDGAARTPLWEIGADDTLAGPPVTNYRSIGTNATPYITGQVIATTGSSVVNGTGGTTWKDSNRGRGDQITINAVNYTILSVNSNIELVLTTPFQSLSGSYSYSITRKFTSLQAWYDCVDASAACPGVSSSNLVSDRRREVGIAYKDGILDLTGAFNMDTATTSAANDITLTADPGNRHLGLPGTGVFIDSQSSSIRPYNSFMTFEWLEIRNSTPRAFHIDSLSSPNKLVIRYCLFGPTVVAPMKWLGPHDADVYNNIMYGSIDAIDISSSTVNVYNNTIYNVSGRAVVASASTVTLRNNIAHTCGGGCFSVPGPAAASSNNLSSDGSASSVNPGGDSPLWNGVALGAIDFVNPAGGNLHINGGSRAQNGGADLSGVFTNDIDDLPRVTTWDIGADEITADLAITKDDGQATAVLGGPITYTITVTNLGPSAVAGVTVTDTLPASLTGASWNCAASPGSSCASSGAGSILDTINLLVGGTVAYTLSATVDPGAASPLDNTATVAPPAGVNDPDSTNNADTDSDALIPPADLQALKTGPATALLGDTIVYSVTAKNNGPANAGVVTLVDTLPPEVEFLSSMPAGPDCNYSAGSHRLTCTIASLTASSTYPVLITVRVVSPGSVVNVASVSGPDPDIPGNNTVTFTTDVAVPSDEVQFFTVTSRKGENVLEWLYPALSYNTVRIVFNTGITSCAYTIDPMGGDGTILLPPPPPGAVNGHDSYLHAGLTDSHEYCYTIFVDTGGGNYSVGRSNRGRPFDTSCGSCFTKWAYSVGNTSMAPPGIGVDTVHAVANDNALHSMRKAGRFEEGTWPSGWRPKDTGGPSQGRPTTINIPTGSAARVIFLGSQNGNVYAVDADAGGPGHEWATPLATLWGPGTRVQATPSGVFTGFGGSRDYVLVGTRRPDEDNAFYALDRATGTPVGPPWPFTGTGPTDKIGVINFQASVDYGNHRVYFTSFARGGGFGSNTVWCLDFWTMGVVWKKAYAT